MGDPFRNQHFPLGALIGAAALIGFTLLAVTAARLSGIGIAETPPAPPVATRDLRFADRADGAILVYEAGSDAVVEVMEPGRGGFVRGVLRALARERRSHGGEPSVPFRLALHEDGRLTLEDLSTGRLIDLRAFGSTNAEAFGRLLPAGGPRAE